METYPKLPVLKGEATDDTAALTCYALEWREMALKAEVQRDALLQALRDLFDEFTIP